MNLLILCIAIRDHFDSHLPNAQGRTANVLVLTTTMTYKVSGLRLHQHKRSVNADQGQPLMTNFIKLLESPIPAAAAPAAPPSQKASSGDISGTKRGTIDPLVSKRPEKILSKKI